MGKKKEKIEIPLNRDDEINPKDKVTIYIFDDSFDGWRDFKVMASWERSIARVSYKLGIKSIESCKNLGELQDLLPKPLKAVADLRKIKK